MIPLLLLLLTTIYVWVSAYKLKAIPESLSATYYLWPSWVFPFFMAATGIILLPYWLEATKDSNWQFLSFISCVSFIFVGCVPDFRNDKGEYQIHVICGYLAAATALLCLMFVLNT